MNIKERMIAMGTGVDASNQWESGYSVGIHDSARLLDEGIEAIESALLDYEKLVEKSNDDGDRGIIMGLEMALEILNGE